MTAPRLIVIAGPNGSGKSTLTDKGQLVALGLALPVSYINADRIATELQASQWQGPQEEREKEAFRRARDLRRVYREAGSDFAFETVFSHPSTLIDMQLCRAVGYEVTLIYVTTGNVEINIARVEGRVRQGGHEVPVNKIRERYHRAMALLPRVVEEANRAFVFDSSTEEPMRLCYLKQTMETPLHPPPYLQVRLVDVLKSRRVERDQIAAQFGSVVSPDEAAGESAGPLVFTGSCYTVQEVKPDTFVRHDRLLVPDIPGDAGTVVIQYHEGVATLTGIP